MEEVLSGGFQTRTEGPCKRDAYNSAKTISKSQCFFSGNIALSDGRIKKNQQKKNIPRPKTRNAYGVIDHFRYIIIQLGLEDTNKGN